MRQLGEVGRVLVVVRRAEEKLFELFRCLQRYVLLGGLQEENVLMKVAQIVLAWSRGIEVAFARPKAV
jgi:hypothetical protein